MLTNGSGRRRPRGSAFCEGSRGSFSMRYALAKLIAAWAGAAGIDSVTEMSGRVIDNCLQLWGGAGYMDEMPISRIYTSNRVLRIYAGTSEILKRAIARAL